MGIFLLDDKKMCQIYKDTEKALDKTLLHIVQYLNENHMTAATAESCTGGLLSQMITSVPGASRVFELGICTYSERMKTSFLYVPESLIAGKGVISAEVAAEMAKGLRQISQADLCLSVTGLAGPSGGTPEQPVGTVYIGVLSGQSMKIAHLKLWQFGLQSREEIRYGTAVCVFGLAEQCLLEEAECRKKNKML